MRPAPSSGLFGCEWSVYGGDDRLSGLSYASRLTVTLEGETINEKIAIDVRRRMMGVEDNYGYYTFATKTGRYISF